jgi:hypothetical protein
MTSQQIQALHDWQELVGAIVVALTLVVTVGRIIGTEWRRRNEEAIWLRVALGTEFRQIAKHALAVQEQVLKLLPSVNPNVISPPRTLKDLQSVVRFPDAVIYSHVGSGLGLLGEYANDLVLFYLELWKIRDSVLQLRTSSSLELQMISVPSSQLLDVAASLLNAIGNATAALPGLTNRRSSAPDGELTAELAAAQERLAALRKSFAFRA